MMGDIYTYHQGMAMARKTLLYIAVCMNLIPYAHTGEEIEKKFTSVSPKAIEHLQNHAQHKKSIAQWDRYFDTPNNDLYQDGEYIRLRREKEPNASAKNILCYKRVLHNTYGNQYRQENEETINNVDSTIQNLFDQGKTEIASFYKERTQYVLLHNNEPFEIAIDVITFNKTPQTFTEIEYAGKQLSKDTALTYIDAIANQLGLHKPEYRSNLDIALQQTGTKQ